MRLYPLAFVLLMLVLASCNRESSPIGIDILPDSDFVGIRVFDSTADSAEASSSTFVKPITASSSSIISVGSTPEYNSLILMRWLYLPDSVGQRGRIVEARITMRPLSYLIGDSTAPLQFDVKKINGAWSSFTFTSDSLAGLDVDAVPSSQFNATVNSTTPITLDIDSALARSWLDLAAEGKTYNIRGVLLDPRAYTSNVRAFESAFGDNPPEFHIVIEHEGRLDTIRGEAPEDTYVCVGPEATPDSDMMVHGGLAYRGKLHIDVSAIPKVSIINNVKLYLHRDSTRTRKHYRGIDTVLVYVSTDDVENTFPSSGTLTRTGSSPHEFIAEGGALVAAVQDWISGKRNNGFILVKLAEVSDIDQLWFYGADAPPGKRPRLEITYTTEP